MYRSKHCDLRIGFDYWVQAKEELGMLVHDIPVDLPFVVHKALRPAAYQGKLFFNAGYFGRLCDNTLICEFNFLLMALSLIRALGKIIRVVYV